MALILAPSALCGCVASDHLVQERSSSPTFDAAAFFVGETRGEGELNVIFKRTEPVLVAGRGAIEPDGTIILDQDVRRGNQAPTHRTWRLRQMPLRRSAAR